MVAAVLASWRNLGSHVRQPASRPRCSHRSYRHPIFDHRRGRDRSRCPTSTAFNRQSRRLPPEIALVTTVRIAVEKPRLSVAPSAAFGSTAARTIPLEVVSIRERKPAVKTFRMVLTDWDSSAFHLVYGRARPVVVLPDDDAGIMPSPPDETAQRRVLFARFHRFWPY